MCSGVRRLPVNIGHSFELFCDEWRTVQEYDLLLREFAKKTDTLDIEKGQTREVEQ